jgi:hypothetical protein
MSDNNKELGIKYFNQTWDYLDNPNKTDKEILEMIDCALKSKYYWELSGKPINFVRSNWQVSRVLFVSNLLEGALLYAKEGLLIYETNNLNSPLDLFFAYESLARAYNGLNIKDLAQDYYLKAKNTINLLTDKEDINYSLSELSSIII